MKDETNQRPKNLTTAIFSPEERAQTRTRLLEHAACDSRISGAAITGSAATGREDRWSDIDLGFGVAGTANIGDVITDWTAHMYDRFSALHHLDVISGPWTYRVFLLPSTLQIDLAFVPETEFRALTPSFQLVLGNAQAPRHALPPTHDHLIGLAWLYSLHARSCIARQKFWQAEFMISGIRDYALALACLRCQLPTAYGRGFDQLPTELIGPFRGTLVQSLETDELVRAFRQVVGLLICEIRNTDYELAERLEKTLTGLTEV